MQLKSLELESSNDYYDAFLDSLTITTDILSDPIILKVNFLFCALPSIAKYSLQIFLFDVLPTPNSQHQ